MREDDLATQILKDFDTLVGDRGTFDSHCAEIARMIDPEMKNAFQSGFRNEGEKRSQEIYDATASLALNRFAAIVDSLLTPRNQKYHRLSTSNADLNKQRDVQLYFQAVNDILFSQRYAPYANFAAQNYRDWRSMGAYGNGVMFVDDFRLRNGVKRGLRYKALNLSDTYFDENHQGIVDKMYRRMKLSARQAISQFGKEKLPEIVLKAAANDQNRKFEIIHCVKPRGEDYDPERKDSKGMEWASYYVLREEKKILEEGGYDEWPFPVSRYDGSERYARSPAMDALPAVKTLFEQKKTLLKAGHRAVDPIYLMADDGIMDVFSARPGTGVPGGVSSDGRPLVHTLMPGKVEFAKELMDEERSQIKAHFLVDLFQILMETPQMTATEVMERVKEKGILLAPTIGRQETEKIGPMVARELDVLSKQGMLPRMPDVLREAGGDYNLIHESPLSRAQRAEEAAGIMRTLEQALNIFNVTQDPSVVDFFDFDQIMPAIADINGVPAKWMKSLDQVNQIRAQREQQKQDEMMVNAAPAGAAMLKAAAAAKKSGMGQMM